MLFLFCFSCPFDLITPVLTSMHVYGEYGGIRGRWVDDRSKRTPADGTSEYPSSAGSSERARPCPNSPVYTEGKAQLSPRLARLFVVFFVDLVRNVRDGKRSTLPIPNPTTLCIQRTSRS